jgi:hypothetical protein
MVTNKKGQATSVALAMTPSIKLSTDQVSRAVNPDCRQGNNFNMPVYADMSGPGDPVFSE